LRESLKRQLDVFILPQAKRNKQDSWSSFFFSYCLFQEIENKIQIDEKRERRYISDIEKCLYYNITQ
jgi:hypothetical protein